VEGRLSRSRYGDEICAAAGLDPVGEFREDFLRGNVLGRIRGEDGCWPQLAEEAIQITGLGSDEVHAEGSSESARQHWPEEVPIRFRGHAATSFMLLRRMCLARPADRRENAGDIVADAGGPGKGAVGGGWNPAGEEERALLKSDEGFCDNPRHGSGDSAGGAACAVPGHGRSGVWRGGS